MGIKNAEFVGYPLKFMKKVIYEKVMEKGR
jgi:hypothetical protein